MRRAVFLALVVVAAAAVLGWLRDPAWLAGVESGFGAWARDAAGVEYRWTAGRASFFVPADLGGIILPLRLPVQPGEWPVTVTIAVDDRTADRLTISDDSWHRPRIPLPARGSRHLRRIDVHVDRTRPGNRGVQAGRPVPIPR